MYIMFKSPLPRRTDNNNDDYNNDEGNNNNKNDILRFSLGLWPSSHKRLKSQLHQHMHRSLCIAIKVRSRWHYQQLGFLIRIKLLR